MVLPGLLLAIWLVAGVALLWVTLDAAQRGAIGAAVGPLVETHGVLPFAWWAVAAGLAAWAAQRLYVAHVQPHARLTDATRVLLRDPRAPAIEAPTVAVGDLTGAINALADERRALVENTERLVAEASRGVAEERDQLGALMAELHQSVVVCNLAGRMLLYNGRARSLFRRLSQAPRAMGGSELVGLGRSIFGVIDQALIAHALETVERRIARGEATVTTRFVTGTPAGHLLLVSLAPVRPATRDGALTGYVLLLDDITDDYAQQSRRDGQLLELTEASRASLASVQAALDMLEYPDLGPEDRERFHGVVREEVAAMGQRLAALDAGASQDLMTRWPLQEMLATDLAAAAARQIEAATGRPVAVAEVEADLWINVDSFALIEALSFLGRRLADAFDQTEFRLRLSGAGTRAHLDLIWTGGNVSSETLADWESGPMQIGGERSPLSVRDVAERHGGEVWFERDRGQGPGFFRFLLPLASVELDAAAPLAARPEFYDFDLFAATESTNALDDRPLTELAYTVFDSETTGLDPASGDEIIQLGAVRIVNGKLLRGESFDQLVDPGRSIPEASIPFHGIRPEMVRGQPLIGEVLPAFHAFAEDTVLVGHNVAFDMRFLKLKEDTTGVRFEQPVLDTLLLASVVHPKEESQSLEAIAGRLGVEVRARHSAAGDALTTAQVFLKILPLLGERGISTLGAARAASESSYYARLRY
ncbi:MAG: DNA polymerase III subunit epsilon [Rhodobacteraceae bacterium]|nr:DNA polymerase III subunit epsilon [Paracoccaceae bacterium]